MNVDLEKTFSFSSILAVPDSVPWINSYDVCVRMRPLTENHTEYNIAYGRMKFWFTDIMQDALLIELQHEKLQAWRETGTRYLDFPIYPVDQVLGLMLMSKLTAMVEGRIEIHQVSISSPADDFVIYNCDQNDVLHWFDQPGWWKDHGPTHSTGHRRIGNSDKVIAISRTQDWKDYELDWNTAGDTKNVSVLHDPDRDA